ncbi:hypothetical protein [Streptomyces gilvosporeus]|uniref:hypothetical protein n=1 Tax=Streptomyces gilvosporeus TaxID=553510 RepID=UPI000D1A8833|nr:hypothetical protein [Streptomyces gilvosporeus]
MGSPQLILCAAVAACVVTAAPVYAAEGHGAGAGTASIAAAPVAAPLLPAENHPAGPGHGSRRSPASEQNPANRELSSTSAVGLVLAGGALLVVAGQVLRLRLRLRREREGGGSGEER